MSAAIFPDLNRTATTSENILPMPNRTYFTLRALLRPWKTHPNCPEDGHTRAARTILASLLERGAGALAVVEDEQSLYKSPLLPSIVNPALATSHKSSSSMDAT